MFGIRPRHSYQDNTATRAFFRALRNGVYGATLFGAVAGTALLANDASVEFNFNAMDTVAAPQESYIKFAGFADPDISAQDRRAALDKLRQVVDILGATPTGRALMAQGVEARIGVMFDRGGVQHRQATGYYEDGQRLVSLDDTLGVLTMVLTAAHELRHGAQFRFAGYEPALGNSIVRANGLSHAIEADARAFETIVALEYALLLRGQGKSPEAVIRALDYKEGEYVVAAMLKTESLETLTDATRRELAAQIFETYYGRFGDRPYYEAKRVKNIEANKDGRFFLSQPDARDTENIRGVTKIGGETYLPAAFDLADPRYSGYEPAAYERIVAIFGRDQIAGKLAEYAQEPGQYLQRGTVRSCLRDLAYHTKMKPDDRLFCGVYLEDPGMMRDALAQGGRLIGDYVSMTAGDVFSTFLRDSLGDPAIRAEIVGLILAEADKGEDKAYVLRDLEKMVTATVAPDIVHDRAFQDIVIHVMTRCIERDGVPFTPVFTQQEGVSVADKTTETGRTKKGAFTAWERLYADIRARVENPQTAAEHRLAGLVAAMPRETLSFRYEIRAPNPDSALNKLRQSVADYQPKG